MDTRQLAAFCAVVELRSFSHAAERLGVTQPAVSLQVRSLEKRLGIQLLDRSGRRFTFRAAMGAPEALTQVQLDVAGVPVTAITLRVGNPQCVVLGPATEERLQSIASALSVHPHFPEGTNVELAEVLSPGRVRILIWERGVGPTESSGTGMEVPSISWATPSGVVSRKGVVP